MARVLSSNIVWVETQASPVSTAERTAEDTSDSHSKLLPAESPITRALLGLLGEGIRVLDRHPPPVA